MSEEEMQQVLDQVESCPFEEALAVARRLGDQNVWRILFKRTDAAYLLPGPPDIREQSTVTPSQPQDAQVFLSS
jgi:hypothetical protein